MATLKTIQDTELQMMSFLDKECTRLGIRYCMVAGTLLGAVRHKGFIPWDDDIDIYMSMKDIDILKREFNSHEYFLQTPETDKEMPFIMLKIRKNGTFMPESGKEHLNMHQGVWLDIFVYTNAAKGRLNKK